MAIIPHTLFPIPSPDLIPTVASYTGTWALETGSLGLKHFSGVILNTFLHLSLTQFTY